MKQGIFKITSNEKIAKLTYKMVLSGDTSTVERPGQFVNIAIGGLFLRRPISVCDCDGGSLTVIYKTVGRGTGIMSEMSSGQSLDLLTGLGNGYDTSKSGGAPLLIGGGAGVPPMYGLAKKLIHEGKRPTVIMGFNTSDEIFYVDEFKSLDVDTVLATADGSKGTRGFVTDCMNFPYTYVFTCGPEPMLKAVYEVSETSGQFSFEERMGCGFGACMGCSCETKYGSKRICRDGPVLEKEEIIW